MASWKIPCCHGNFTTIQSAIDSIPSGNAKWIRIQIFAGVYREKVTITYDKTCIFLDGAGSRETFIEWDGHESTNTSSTFTSYAKNLVVKGIGFKNDLVPALSAEILGDKAASYNCSFFGVQDTLWDVGGRHYFYQCYIQGGADFIFGNGQSFYEQSVLYYSLETYGNGTYIGYITAQGRDSAEESSGFVFKDCVIHGRGIAYLGRAWKAFSRVVIANSKLSDIVVPVGWDAWQFVGHDTKVKAEIWKDCWLKGGGPEPSRCTSVEENIKSKGCHLRIKDSAPASPAALMEK
ncbi:hypothetical protein ACB092_10G084200 [Castanea dentata]